MVDESTPQDLTEYVESSLTLERDLEDQIVGHLDILESGLKLVSRQETSDVGRLDLLARDSGGRTVIIELKAGEAKDAPSFKKYVHWAKPQHAVRFSKRGYVQDGLITNLPLYLACRVKEFL